MIATASEPLGGETTVIALDAALTSTGRQPALDLVDERVYGETRIVFFAVARPP